MGLPKPDGTTTWLTMTSHPLFQGDGTTLIGVVTCFADITDRKRIEEVVRRTNADLAWVQRSLERSPAH
jgi:hypothetical protein